MWGIESDEITAMAKARRNTTYLPEVEFPDGLEVTTEFEEAVSDAKDVLLVVPSHAFRETLERLTVLPAPPQFVAWATKGFEAETGLLPHQVADDVLESKATTAVLSGPTFAVEVRSDCRARSRSHPAMRTTLFDSRRALLRITFGPIPQTTLSVLRSAAPPRTSWPSAPEYPTDWVSVPILESL